MAKKTLCLLYLDLCSNCHLISEHSSPVFSYRCLLAAAMADSPLRMLPPGRENLLELLSVTSKTRLFPSIATIVARFPTILVHLASQVYESIASISSGTRSWSGVKSGGVQLQEPLNGNSISERSFSGTFCNSPGMHPAHSLPARRSNRRLSRSQSHLGISPVN